MQTKKKTARRSLAVSAVALLLSVAMLVGTTFAWFTDTVSSGVNQIKAGNLDIELEYSKDGHSWNTVKDATDLFNDVTLWEPGATSVVYLRLSNKGTLDLKYRFSMKIGGETTGTNVNGAPFKLSDYLQFSVIEGDTVYSSREEARIAAGTGTKLSEQKTAGRAHDEVGTMRAGADARRFALVVFMPEDVENEANYKVGTAAPTIDLGLNLNATQLASESDSFDNQYDGGANVEGDLMQSASAVVTAPAQDAKLEIVLNNNAPVSNERSTTMTMENTPEELAGKKVEFSATTYNASATQNEPNFSIATGNNTEVAALKLDLTVEGHPVAVGTERTVTTYIDTGLSDVKVTYVPETGNNEMLASDHVQYDPATGKLTFTTTHFSDYVVTAKALKEDGNGVYEIYNANDLFAFARLVNVKGNTFSGKTVKLMNDIDLSGKIWTPVGQTGGYSAKAYFQGTFDGNGRVISNLNIPESTWEAGNDEGTNFATGFFGFIDEGGNTIKHVTFENATVKGHHWVGVAAGYMTGTVSNVSVTNSTITSSYENSKADGDKAGGVVGYLNSGSVTGCSVTDSTITAIRDCGSVVGYSNGTVTGNTAENCTVYYSTDNDEQIGGEIAGKRALGVSDNTATNVKVVKKLSTQEQLDSALQSGDTVEVILTAGNFKLKSGMAQNKTVTIKGERDTIIDLAIASNNKLNYQHDATLTFEGVTLQGQSSGNYGGLAHVVKTTFNNCIIEGKVTLYGDAEFNNCIFNNNNDYSIWTWGAKNAKFVGCTFNSGGKALLLYGGADSTETPTTNLTVTDCVFNDDGTLSTDKAAIEIGNDYGAVYNLTVRNITVDGFAINPAGISTGSNIWANKNSMDRDHLNVVINDVDVY